MFSRRGFLAGLGALVGGVLLEEAIPFGRVWSFPTNIVVSQPNTLLCINEISYEALRILEKNIRFTKHVSRNFDDTFGRDGAKIGSIIHIKKPARFVFGQVDKELCLS